MTDGIVPQKRCARCRKDLPATKDYFTRDKNRKGGLNKYCRPCASQIHFEKHPEREHLRQQRERRNREGLKLCPGCGLEKPATPEYFSRHSGEKSGLQDRCKPCYKKYTEENSERLSQQHAQYRLEHSKELAEQKRQYQQKNRESHRAYHRHWYLENKERVRITARLNYQKNKERIAEWGREYHRRNPHISRAASLRRKARKRSLPNTFTARHWLLCLDYWHYCCAVCGGQLRDLFGDIEPHGDHWIPMSDKRPDNPGTSPSNMLCLCSSCNLTKNKKDSKEWLISRYGNRKASEILKRIEAYFEWIKQQS